MDLKFSELSVDTSLAQEYLKKNTDLFELYNDYYETATKFHPYVYDGVTFIKEGSTRSVKLDKKSIQDTQLNMASSLKQNANLIAQLEYHFRNIPIEVTNMQLNLLIKFISCTGSSYLRSNRGTSFYSNGSLLMFGSNIRWVCYKQTLSCYSKTTAAICHLLATLFRNAGARNFYLQFKATSTRDFVYYNRFIITFPVKGLDSGTVAVVTDDADVDSAVDKLISVSGQAPWRLRRILVQESVYQQFKDALSWKCNFKKSGNERQPPTYYVRKH